MARRGGAFPVGPVRRIAVKEAVNSGYWPLYRFDPAQAEHLPFQLDSRKPKIPYTDFANKEARFAMLSRIDPEAHARLAKIAQQDINERWRWYEQLAGVERSVPGMGNGDLAETNGKSEANTVKEAK